jgi:hypothetical protein
MYDDSLFIDALEKVVQGKEDYVYFKPTGSTICRYQDSEGCPSCIIGYVLDELGIELDPEWDNQMKHQSGKSALTLLIDLGFSNKLARIARCMQNRQDNGFTWGECLTYFKASYTQSHS